MVHLPTFLTFYAAVLAIQLSPGPDMLLVIGRGVGQGRRTALMSAVGMTLVAGFVQVLLLALGIASARSGRHSRSAAVAPSMSDAAALREGTINNLTNPKALVFLFAFLPQFVDPANGWPVAVQLLLLGAVTKLSNFAVLSTVALGAGTIGRWLARRPALIAWQERFAGVVMVGLGLRLAVSGDVRSAR